MITMAPLAGRQHPRQALTESDSPSYLIAGLFKVQTSIQFTSILFIKPQTKLAVR